MHNIIIYQGNTIIINENLPDYPHPVVVKKPAEHYASRRIIQSLETEYEVTRYLNEVEGVRKALALKISDDQPELIMEYIDGVTLHEYIKKRKLKLRSRLAIAIDLANILKKVHQQQVILLNLNSENILIGEKHQTVHVIDLGTASQMGGEGYHKVRPDQVLENLACLSPEQTGRINRKVDERSDLYALGVVLYELMSGQLPFNSINPAELIHQHIAHEPTSPGDVSPDIPDVISRIILNLLEKNAEDRYQSAAGVYSDLKKCLQHLAPDNSIEDFPLGEADFSSRFIYPQKLYGRENELKLLKDAFESACSETSSMMFVSGFSGVGKTALVEEIQRPISEKQGFFIKGKFDQYLSITPYSAFSQALTDFVSLILTESKQTYNTWKDEIQSAVGNQGNVITDVIPALEDLIGAQPDVPQLGGLEAENRFNYVFINFLLAVATQKRPLVLFIDDLQWIDAASLRLLNVIRSEFNPDY